MGWGRRCESCRVWVRVQAHGLALLSSMGGRMALPADTVHGSKGDTRVGHVVRVKVRSHITS